MTKKIDRRVSKTRSALQKALVELILAQDYESLTIQDILERANVGRSTFYSHFYDKDDLLHSEFESLQADFGQALHQNTASPDDVLGFSLVMFNHAKDYHAVYQAVVGKQSGQVMQAKIEAYLKTIVHDALLAQWTDEKQANMPLEILENHLISSFIRLLIWWLDSDMPYSPQRMDELYRNLVAMGKSF